MLSSVLVPRWLRAGVPALATASFETDYVLVKAARGSTACGTRSRKPATRLDDPAGLLDGLEVKGFRR